MKKWFDFFLGSPKRFGLTMLGTLVLIAMFDLQFAQLLVLTLLSKVLGFFVLRPSPELPSLLEIGVFGAVIWLGFKMMFGKKPATKKKKGSS